MLPATGGGPFGSLHDGGITWVFYFRKSEVPQRELEMDARAVRAASLRLAVTFGSIVPSLAEYRSTTIVHLWQMPTLPPTVTWKEIFVHIFTHEPLHHAMGRCLAELGERGDQEWAIARLGDGRWW